MGVFNGKIGWRAGLVGLLALGAAVSLLKGKEPAAPPISSGSAIGRPLGASATPTADDPVCSAHPASFLAVGQEFESGKLAALMDAKCPKALWARDETIHVVYGKEAFVIAARKLSDYGPAIYRVDAVRGAWSCARSPLEVFPIGETMTPAALAKLADAHCGRAQKQADGGLEVSFGEQRYRVLVAPDPKNNGYIEIASIRGVPAGGSGGQ